MLVMNIVGLIISQSSQSVSELVRRAGQTERVTQRSSTLAVEWSVWTVWPRRSHIFAPSGNYRKSCEPGQLCGLWRTLRALGCFWGPARLPPLVTINSGQPIVELEKRKLRPCRRSRRAWRALPPSRTVTRAGTGIDGLAPPGTHRIRACSSKQERGRAGTVLTHTHTSCLEGR